MRAKIATNMVEVTPDDAADVSPRASDGVHVNVSGIVRVTLESGAVTTLYLLAGVPYPYAVRRVWATDTTATGIRLAYLDWRNARA